MRTTPTAPPTQPATTVFTLAIVASIATVFLISLGSFVRVTGSGLACPDWPLCHGSVIPPFEYHVLIEYSHRLSAAVVSLLTGALFVITLIAVITRRGPAQRAFVPALITLALLAGQVGLGGVAVLTELPAPIVTLHLALAEAILAMLIVTAVWARAGAPDHQTAPRISPAAARHLLRWAVIAAIATMVVILSGSYVVAAGATISCGGGFAAWPLCDGSLMPKGFEANIHMGHRYAVLVGAILTAQAARVAWRRRAESRAIARVGLVSAHLLALQIIVGALVPWMNFNHAPRVLHITLATATWAALVLLVILAARLRGAEQQPGEPQLDPRAQSPGEVNPPASNPASSPPEGGGLRALVADYITLTKPRVMLLLLLTAFGGMVLAANGLPPLIVAVAVIVGGAFASGGAGAINQGIENRIDAAMIRTRHRPVAGGRVTPAQAIVYGIALNVLSFTVLTLGANLLAAAIAIAGSLVYVFVYTMWLKRTTVQNIVIGGAAGAVPPLVGWAGVTGGLDLPAVYLFLIIFFWTPPHFWALALLIQDDYERAKIPMLPVVLGEDTARTSIFLYTILVNVLVILLYISTQSLSVLFLGAALLLGGVFIYYAARLLREKHRASALRLYKYSLLYLALVFLMVMVDQVI